jgi:hypothetical protein
LPAKQLSLIGSLILLLCSIASFANDTELAVAKVREGTLSAGKPQSFAVTLNAGDFAQINFDPRGKELVVIAYDPSGSKFRGTMLGPDADKFNFVADRPGKYRVEVAASDKVYFFSVSFSKNRRCSSSTLLSSLSGGRFRPSTVSTRGWESL